jgi:hypothetical protein
MSNELAIMNLTTQQVRALACQYKLENWQTEDMGALRRKLTVLAEKTPILDGNLWYGQA